MAKVLLRRNFSIRRVKDARRSISVSTQGAAADEGTKRSLCASLSLAEGGRRGLLAFSVLGCSNGYVMVENLASAFAIS